MEVETSPDDARDRWSARVGRAATALLAALLTGCGLTGCGTDNQQPSTGIALTLSTSSPTPVATSLEQPPPSSTSAPSTSGPVDTPLGLQYYSRVGGADDALGVQVDSRTGHDTIWSTFGGACVENCAATIDVVGATSGGVATMLWAGRNIEQRDDGKTVWAVTDVLPIHDGLDVFGNYDCASGVPLVDAANTIVTLLTVDLDSGRFVEMAIEDGHCSVVGE